MLNTIFVEITELKNLHFNLQGIHNHSVFARRRFLSSNEKSLSDRESFRVRNWLESKSWLRLNIMDLGYRVQTSQRHFMPITFCRWPHCPKTSWWSPLFSIRPLYVYLHCLGRIWQSIKARKHLPLIGILISQPHRNCLTYLAYLSSTPFARDRKPSNINVFCTSLWRIRMHTKSCTVLLISNCRRLNDNVFVVFFSCTTAFSWPLFCTR